MMKAISGVVTCTCINIATRAAQRPELTDLLINVHSVVLHL